MSDDARRAAERRWRETGEVDDGRRFLAQLVRAGGDEVQILQVRLAIRHLHEERVLLAAHVGHAPARAALGARAPSRAASPDPTEAAPLEEWARDLHDFGQAVSVRAALAAGRLTASTLPAEATDRETDPRRALDAAEDWLACPCPRHRSEAEAWNPLRGRMAAWAWQTVTAAHCPPGACGQRVWHHVQAICSAAAAIGEEPVRAAIREALLPWALPPSGAAERLERPPEL